VVLAKLARRLRATLYSHEDVVVLAKDLGDVTDMSSDGLRVEELEERHLPALYEFNRARCNSAADRRTAARVERGYRGFVAHVGDELVGYYWWVDRDIEPDHGDIARYGLEIDLQPDEVYGFDYFLLEQHRGGGNSMEFLYKVESALRDLGYRTLWGYVIADNKPARWLYGLRGYTSVRRSSARRVLTRRM
jgi:hypothetical protein